MPSVFRYPGALFVKVAVQLIGMMNEGCVLSVHSRSNSKDMFEQITSIEALFAAWESFQRGKRSRQDVQWFWRRLESNLFALRRELISGTYTHGAYESFFVNDPKPRHIRKAQVRDRILHQALYSVLSQIWEPRFIHDVYSARLGKGTHYGVNRLWMMLRKVSRNFTASCWALIS